MNNPNTTPNIPGSGTSRLSLADAIRLGAMITGPTIPGVGDFFERNPRTNKICLTCAIGAVYVAVRGLEAPEGQRPEEDLLFQAFPILRMVVECPVEDCWCKQEDGDEPDQALRGSPYSLGNIASHLFENHEWPREQIAAWVESIERFASAEPALVASEDEVMQNA